MKPHLLLILAFIVASCTPSKAWRDISVSWSISTEGLGYTTFSGNQLIGFTNSWNALISIDIVKQNIIWQKTLNNNYTIGYRQLESGNNSVFVYIPGQGLHIYSQEGELLSKTPAPNSLPPNSIGEFGAGPTLYQQTLYLPISNLLFAYDVSDPKQPKLIWEREFPHSDVAQRSIWALAVDGQGGLYVGIAYYTGQDTLQALDTSNGQTIWTANTTPPIIEGGVPAPTALVVVGEKVIAAVESSFTIQAFDRNSGKRIYVSEDLSVLCPDGQGTIDGFEVTENNLYVSPREGTCIYGINAETGKVLWTHSSQVDPNINFTYGGKPKYVNGVVYASNSALWALDAKTGKVLAISSNRDDDAIFTNVQYANGEILVWGKNLTAYKPIR